MSDRFNSEQQFVEWNEEMARKYDPEAYHLRSNFLIRWIERRRVKTILHLLKAGEQDRVLEVGCGAGNVLEQISADRLHGIDLSTFLLKKSYHRLANRHAYLAQANAERLPFAQGRFDKIICTEVLEHVPDPRRVVAEMVRIASDRAVLVFSVPNEPWIEGVKSLIRRLGLNRWLLRGNKKEAYSSPEHMTDEWHLHSFDRRLLDEISSGQLDLREIKAVPFNFIPLRYVGVYRVGGPES